MSDAPKIKEYFSWIATKMKELYEIDTITVIGQIIDYNYLEVRLDTGKFITSA